MGFNLTVTILNATVEMIKLLIQLYFLANLL